jgi:peptide methionine sulfoxide reductase MsrA
MKRTEVRSKHGDFRSAIFYHDEEQRRTAERVKERVERSGKWRAGW